MITQNAQEGGVLRNDRDLEGHHYTAHIRNLLPLISRVNRHIRTYKHITNTHNHANIQTHN